MRIMGLRVGFTKRSDGHLSWDGRPRAAKKLPVFLSVWIGPWSLALLRYEADHERGAVDTVEGE